MEDWTVGNRKNKQGPKKNMKRDLARGKPKKHQKKVIKDDFDDAEMLRIQGLVRCNNCESPYPAFLDICPMCE